MVRPRNVNRYVEEKEIPDWEQETFNSRNEIKKAAQAVTDMGEMLSDMSENKIHKMPLTDEIRKAVLDLKEMKQKRVGPALKRQRLFLGRLLRTNEHVIRELKAKMYEEEQKSKLQNAHFQRLEKWRDRMIEEGDDALNVFMSDYPQVDRTQLRQLIRNAQKERAQEKPPKSARLIFQYLKGLEW